MKLRSTSIKVPLGIKRADGWEIVDSARASGYRINDLWVAHVSVDYRDTVAIAALPCGKTMGRFLGKVADVARAAIQAKPPTLSRADAQIIAAGEVGPSPAGCRKIIAWRERITALLAAQTGARA